MKVRRFTSSWALWVFAAALLLKSAVPWLASAAAQVQGKTLVEVCTVYGVSLVPLEGADPSGPAPQHAVAHGDEHCVLTGLLALAAPQPHPVSWVAPPAVLAATSPDAAVVASPTDAAARWLARLRHGPPRFS